MQRVGVHVFAGARGTAAVDVRLAAGWTSDSRPELARLQIRAYAENAVAARGAEKAGFTREGVLRAQRFSPVRGRPADVAVWSLLREELRA